MALKPPGWASHAVPTLRGWVDPQTGELLKSQRISQAQLDEHNGTPTPPAKPKVLKEVMAEDDYANMSKKELEAVGREHGIELDRRKNKKTLVERLKGVVGQ